MTDAPESATSGPAADDPAIDPGEFRRVLGHFPTGVTVVTCMGDDGPVGVAIGSFVSISLDPPLVGFFLGTESASGVALESAGRFCVNILSEDQTELCGRMASKDADKFAGIDWSPSAVTASPQFPGVHASIDCRLDSVTPAGDHNLLIGRVLDLRIVEGDRSPMVFHLGRYARVG